jgi:hypothetical protein
VTAAPAGYPSSPSKVRAKVKGHTLTVSWSPAGANGSPVTAYRIAARGLKTRIVKGAARRAVFKNVRPGTYRIRVSAVNAVGAGAASRTLKVRVR